MAVTVTFVVPVAAVLLAVKVSVVLPLPGAGMEAALKLAVTPEGNPETDRETAALKLPLAVVEIVLVVELPCTTDKLVGEAANVKSGVTGAVIVSESVAV